MKQALVVGSRGQDGTLLRELLEAKGYAVTGLDLDGLTRPDHGRGPSVPLTDAQAVADLVGTLRPEEIYYLAAYHQSSQGRGREDPGILWTESMAVNALGPALFLEAVRRGSPGTRFFYAGSCLVFGVPGESPQTEATCFRPACVYGISKTAGMHACRHYRENHGLFAVGGILYNHESHLRPEQYLSRKIVRGVWRIKTGQARELVLGDLGARADWGYAPDYAEAFWRTLQATGPADYVVATGRLRSVLDWVEKTFELAGLDWHEHVREDASLLAGRRVPLVGDASRLREVTGWTPSTTFERMVELMYEYEGGTF